MKTHHITIAAALLLPFCAAAQDLNSEITVTHQIVPEEQAATRLSFFPAISLPQVAQGRLRLASGATSAPISPFISTLEPAPWQAALTQTPYRGYAALAYGPIYNLGASAGYRVVNRQNLWTDLYGQFNGYDYSKHYFGIPYHGKVSLHRNTVLAGARTQWNPTKVNGSLTASVLYSFSGYNFPVLEFGSWLTTPNTNNVHIVDANANWSGREKQFTYSFGGGYDLIAYRGSHRSEHNHGKLTASAEYAFNSTSTWGLNMKVTLGHSSIDGPSVRENGKNLSVSGNKGVYRLEAFYQLSRKHFVGHFGAAMDIRLGNIVYFRETIKDHGDIIEHDLQRFIPVPEINLVWRPSGFFSLWGNAKGRVEENSRLALQEEQPYLLGNFSAGYSKVYSADAGITIGPWKGASIQFFGGFMQAYDWYLPAIETGYMASGDINGWHFGGNFAYDYRQYLSLNLSAEFAPNQKGRYNHGYAPWRDHARANIVASVSTRPIDKLSIELKYQARLDRNKITPIGYLDLGNIHNLSATAQYQITPQWTAFITGENLANQEWYLGPSIPCQGINGQIGAQYKF